jgi:hypothetical protein
MANRIYLQMQLQKAVRKYGENAPVTLEIKRQIDQIERSKLSGQYPQLLQALASFRKVKQSKGPKA